MSDKTVKIEYQFSAEDKGLSDKIDKINKSLDELEDHASDSSKKVNNLEGEISSLTGSISNSTAKVDAYADELKEMQKELDKATADVEQLNQALLKQQQIMKSFNSGSSGMVNNQREVNALAEQTTQKMAQIAQLQNRINAKGIDFKSVPTFKKLESSLSSVNKQLDKANNLSNQLSNNTPVIKAGAVKKSNEEIGNDFKFMRRVELSNLAKENPNSKYSKAKERFDLADRNYNFDKHQVESLQKSIATYSEPPKPGYTQKEYDNELSRLKKQLDIIMPRYIEAEKERTNAIANAMKTMGYYTEDGYEIDKSNVLMPGSNSKRATLEAEKKLDKQYQHSLKTKERMPITNEPFYKELNVSPIGKFEGIDDNMQKYLDEAKNNIKTMKAELDNAKKSYNKNDGFNESFNTAEYNYLKAHAEYAKRIADVRDYLNNPNQSQQKAIPQNIQEVDNLTSKINSKAVELQDAINNNDTALVGQLQGEVKNLLNQRQALEKLQGKRLRNTTGKSYSTPEVKESIIDNPISSTKALQETNYQDATNTVNKQLQAQQALNNESREYLSIQKEIAEQNANTAKQNERTADKTTKNIKAEKEAQQEKHALTLANIEAYEESKKRQHQESRTHAENKRNDKDRHDRRKKYKQAIEKLPNELQNVTDKYKQIESEVQLEARKIDAVNESITKAISGGHLKEEDFNKIEKTALTQKKKVVKLNSDLDKLNQRAEKILNVTGSEAQRVSKIKLKNTNTEDFKGKSYKANKPLSGHTGTFGTVKNYKAMISDMTGAQKQLSSSMLDLSAKSIQSGTSILKMKNYLGSTGNKIKGVGAGFKTIGNSLSGMSNGFIQAGNNLQNMSNSLRTFSMLAMSAFAMAGQQGIEFNKSITGVASALDRITVNKDGSVSIMSDEEFDNTINKISETARNQARSSIYDANEIAEAYRYTTLAGWSATESMESMQSLIDYATAGRLDGSQFAGMIDDIANSLASLNMVYEGIDIDGDGVFDEKVRKNADDMAESVTRLTDVMSKAQAISTLDPADLVEFYKKGGSQLSTFGLTLEEITSMASVLANRGIKGGTAATGMSSLMANLTGKTGQAKKALDEIYEKTGVDIYAWDKNGQYIGIDKHLSKLTEAFDVLKKKYGSEYGVDNLQLAQLLGGKHHFKSLTKLLEGYQSGEFTETVITLENSKGATAEMADIANDSTWAQLKMTLSEVKEAMLSLWEAVEPSFLKILEVIKKVARAFTELSDEQKMNIAKWVGFIVVGGLVLGVLSAIFTIIGTVIGGLSALANGIGTVIMALGGIVSAFAGWTTITNFISGLSPAMALLVEWATKLKGVIASFGVGNTGVVIGSFTILLNLIKMVTRAFNDAKRESTGFLDTIGRTIYNTGEQLEHASMGIAKAFNKMFNIDTTEISKNIAKTFMVIINMIDGLINLLTFGLANKLSEALGKKTGLGGLKEHIMGKLSIVAKEGKKDLFESSLDKKAKEKGYKDYDSMYKSNQRQERLEKITTLFDGEETGAFSALIKKLQGAEDTEVNLTVKDIQSDAGSYRSLVKSIENDKSNIIKLEADIEINENKIKDYNKKLQELKKKIDSTTNSKEKKKLQTQYQEIKEKRDTEIDTKITNQEELQKTMDGLTEKEEKEIVIKTTYEENGMGEELEYESKKDDFEKLHGSKLSYVDYETDKANAQAYLNAIPELKKQLQLKLQTTTDTSDWNDTYYLLERLEEMELNLPVYIELIDQQKIVDDTKKKMDEATKLIEEAEKRQETILSRNGNNKDNLKGNDLTAYENENKIIEEQNKILEENRKLHNDAENKIANLNGGDLEGVYALWEELYANYNQPLIKLFDEKELAILNSLGLGIDTNTNEEKKSSQVTKPEVTEKDKTKTHSVSTNAINFSTESTNTNTEAVNSNTTAVNNNKDAVKQQGEVIDEVSGKEMDTSGVESFGDKVKTTSEEVNGNIDKLKEGMAEISESLSGINLSGITEAFTLVYTSITEAREALSNIAGFAVNTGTNSFTAMGNALKTSIESARTALMNVAGVANNYGSQALTNMGNSLTNALSDARAKVLSVANVALNYGSNAMSTMGNSLTSALSQAEGIVARIAGNISSVKKEIASIKMPTITMPNLPGQSSLTASIANNPATAGALRSITNNNVSNSIANTSNFSINMSGYNTNSRQEARNTAKILTTHLKRRGF